MKSGRKVGILLAALCLVAVVAVLLWVFRTRPRELPAENLAAAPTPSSPVEEPVAPPAAVEPESLQSTEPSLEPDPLIADVRPEPLYAYPVVFASPPLSPADEAKAKDFWRQWRNSWARFKGLSGNVEIESFDENGNPVKLRAVISLRSDPADARLMADVNHYFPDYQITLTDVDNQWSYSATLYGQDKFECQDSSLEPRLRSVLGKGIGTGVVSIQWDALDSGTSPDPEPSRRGESFFDHHPPSSNPDAAGMPDSYLFAPTVVPKSGARGGFYFAGGDLVRVSYNREGDAIGNVYYEQYEKTGDMRFPMSMRFDFDKTKYNLTFSNLAVERTPEK